MKTDEPTNDAQPSGAAAGVVVLAFVSLGCLAAGIRIGMVIDPVIANVLTCIFFGPIVAVAVLMVLESFLSKVK